MRSRYVVSALSLALFASTSVAQDRALRFDDNVAPPGMVFIEGGPYARGTTAKEAQALAKALKIDRREKERFQQMIDRELVDDRNRVTDVPSFLIDKWEVTNLQYYQFMKATGAQAPQMPQNHPARWRNGRLPGSTSDLFVDEIVDWKNFIKYIAAVDGKAKPGNRIYELLDGNLRGAVDESKKAEDLLESIKEPLVEAITAMLQKPDFYVPGYWGAAGARALKPYKKKGIKKLTKTELARFNRIALDAAFKRIILPGQPEEMQRFPVTALTPYEMRSCARWMGKRLPTEAEWEKAARGGYKKGAEVRVYPWGSKFGKKDVAICNWEALWRSKWNKDMKPASLTPVGTFPKSDSIYGVADMAGNAIEICWDKWDVPVGAPRGIKLMPPPDPNAVILKGGAFGEARKRGLRISWRHPLPRNSAADAVGFRCAKDLNVAAGRLESTADTLFTGIYDKRLTKLHPEGAVTAERMNFLDPGAKPPVIQKYDWIGLLTIKDHVYANPNALRQRSDRTKRKDNRGRVLLGFFHTEVDLDEPNLPAGTYALTYQRGFSRAKIMNANLESKQNGGKKPKKGKKDPAPAKPAEAPKSPEGDKPADKKPADKKEGEAKPDANPAAEGGKPAQDKAKKDKDEPKGVAPVDIRREKLKAGAPEYSTEDRIVFVNERGLPVAAITAPKFEMVKESRRSGLSFLSPTEEMPMAALKVSLALPKKFDANKFLVADFLLKWKSADQIKGWSINR